MNTEALPPPANAALSRLVRVDQPLLLPFPAEFLPHFSISPKEEALFLVEPSETRGLSLSVLGDRIHEDLVPRIPPSKVRQEHPETWYQEGATGFRLAAAALLALPSATLRPDLGLALPQEFPLRTGAEYRLELDASQGRRRLLVHLKAAAPPGPADAFP